MNCDRQPWYTRAQMDPEPTTTWNDDKWSWNEFLNTCILISLPLLKDIKKFKDYQKDVDETARPQEKKYTTIKNSIRLMIGTKTE